MCTAGTKQAIDVWIEVIGNLYENPELSNAVDKEGT